MMVDKIKRLFCFMYHIQWYFRVTSYKRYLKKYLVKGSKAGYFEITFVCPVCAKRLSMRTCNQIKGGV